MFLKWLITRSGSVITDVMSLLTKQHEQSMKNARTKWLRISLRTALLVFATLSVWVGVWSSRSIKQRKSVGALMKLGGAVSYKDNDPSRFAETVATWLGPDFVYDVWAVDLAKTDASDNDIRILANLPSLASISLWETEISGEGLVHLRGLNNLNSLELGFTSVTNESLSQVGTLTSLRYLGLNNAKLVDDEGIQFLASLKNLERLALWNTGTGDNGLKAISKLPKLRVLIAGGTRISDSSTKHLRNNETLEEVNLQRTNIGDVTLLSLSSIPNLSKLTIKETNITDIGLESLAKCTKLTDLSIKNTNVSADGLKMLKSRLPKTKVR